MHKKVGIVIFVFILSIFLISCDKYLPGEYYMSNSDKIIIMQNANKMEQEDGSGVEQDSKTTSETVDETFTEISSDMEVSIDSASMIKIDGVIYDLSQDFEQVTSCMLDNEINIYNGITMGAYDENFQMLEEDIDINIDNTINATKIFSESNLESNYNLSVYCSYYNLNSDKIDFETYQGITEYSNISDLRNLNNKAVNIDVTDSFVCDVLCVNGELVSLDDYNIQYEQWIEDLNSYSITDAVKKHFPNYIYQLLAWVMDVDWFEISDASTFQSATEMMGGDYKQQILFAFALQDIGARLENGEIDHFIIIRYTGTVGERENIQVEYYKYFIIDKTEID